LAEELEVPALEVGEVEGEELRVAVEGGELRAPVAELRRIWTEALPRALEL